MNSKREFFLPDPHTAILVEVQHGSKQHTFLLPPDNTAKAILHALVDAGYASAGDHWVRLGSANGEQIFPRLAQDHHHYYGQTLYNVIAEHAPRTTIFSTRVRSNPSLVDPAIWNDAQRLHVVIEYIPNLDLAQ
jgi:hypothetical protein